ARQQLFLCVLDYRHLVLSFVACGETERSPNQVVFSPSRVARADGLRGERRPWPRAASSRTPCRDASRTGARCAGGGRRNRSFGARVGRSMTAGGITEAR